MGRRSRSLRGKWETIVRAYKIERSRVGLSKSRKRSQEFRGRFIMDRLLDNHPRLFTECYSLILYNRYDIV